METAIRFSRNSLAGNDDQRFLRVDVTGKSFQLCLINNIKRQEIKYDVIHASLKVPTFRAFDWHPVNECLIAVGQPGGEASVVNITDGAQDTVSFSVRNQRLCNAVALSSQNLVAAGLDKVRTDFCLNIWDLNQKIPNGLSRGFSKGHTEPIHRLAGGEPISSLKFFTEEPQLLLAGVKSQFVRLYDLREPNSSNVLQFSTKCVNNIAIDPIDENYFASCYPLSEPMVCVWDRRMISRNNSSPVTFNGNLQSDSKQPEASLELPRAVNNPGNIWSMRFSKSRKLCLGVLSSTGQMKVCDFGQDYTSDWKELQSEQRYKRQWHEFEPQDIFLDNTRDVEKAIPQSLSLKDQKQRIVSFDFTASTTRFGEPQLIVMTGEGDIRMAELGPLPEPTSMSSTGSLCKGYNFIAAPILDSENEPVSRCLDRVRRTAEPRNALRQAFKQAKQNKTSTAGQQTDLRRMSSFANQCWNADLGFFEKGVEVTDLLKLVSAPRLRCESGYLLNVTKNKNITIDSQWIEAYWSWIERAERISRHGNMTQDNVDLSYIGVYSVWMEEIALKPRLVGGNSLPTAAVIRNLVNRLNVPVRRFHPTEYRAHRQLCLHISGLAWTHEELEMIVKKLIGGNQHTKAAAIAIFASDEKLAYQALRSKTSAQTHKMLAMALASSKQRRKAHASASATDDSSTEGEDDWTETVQSLSADLTDPYARAILAYVKSGDWSDVLDIEALPLKHRVGVAIRHLDDNDLTSYIGRTTRQVIEAGDVEGIILTGTGTTEGLGLLSSYTRTFNDLQTAVLGLSVGGAAERFIVNSSNHDSKANRTIEAFREAYRAQIMRWGLKFDRVRFDVASSKALSQSSQHKLPRPKEQIRLVCTFCSGSLTQFPSNGTPGSNASTPGVGPGPSSMTVTDTAKHPLTAEKAAVIGTVCPKCGRHLPRCGVCDMWLGTADDTYAKWFTAQQQQARKPAGPSNGAGEKGKHQSMDLGASMSGSVVTTIGLASSTSANVKEVPLGHINGHETGGEENGVSAADDVEAKLEAAMQKFTVFCVTCSHGFHAAHARLWFEGRNERDGHRVCPVPGCDCRCNG